MRVLPGRSSSATSSVNSLAGEITIAPESSSRTRESGTSDASRCTNRVSRDHSRRSSMGRRGLAKRRTRLQRRDDWRRRHREAAPCPCIMPTAPPREAPCRGSGRRRYLRLRGAPTRARRHRGRRPTSAVHPHGSRGRGGSRVARADTPTAGRRRTTAEREIEVEDERPVRGSGPGAAPRSAAFAASTR